MDRQTRIRENLRQFVRPDVAEANDTPDAPRADAAEMSHVAVPAIQTKAAPQLATGHKRVTLRTLFLWNDIARTFARAAALIAVMGYIATLTLTGQFCQFASPEAVKDWLGTEPQTLLVIATRCCEFLVLSNLIALRCNPIAWIAALVLEGFGIIASIVASAVVTFVLAAIVGDGVEIRYEIAAVIGIPIALFGVFILTLGNYAISIGLDDWNIDHVRPQPLDTWSARLPPPSAAPPRGQNIKLD
jgi:hypothetical protein